MYMLAICEAVSYTNGCLGAGLEFAVACGDTLVFGELIPMPFLAFPNVSLFSKCLTILNLFAFHQNPVCVHRRGLFLSFLFIRGNVNSEKINIRPSSKSAEIKVFVWQI